VNELKVNNQTSARPARAQDKHANETRLLYNRTHAARYLGISFRAVEKLMRDGDLETRIFADDPIKTYILIPHDSLVQFAAQRAAGGPKASRLQ
jgi:hypothetical protein